MVKSDYINAMDFGRGGSPGIPHLPAEHPATALLLGPAPSAEPGGTLFPPEPPVVRVGLSTWGDKAYRGTIYPADARPGDFLQHYSSVFTTVELSATFYGIPGADRFARWRDTVPASFRFLPKVSQSITHRSALADAQQGLREFLDQTAVLADRRGPVLLQLSPRFAPDHVAQDRLAAALAVLGRRAAVELRHPAWFAPPAGEPADALPPAAAILREHGSALVVTDTVGARDVVHGIVTAPTVVLRFVAAGRSVVDDRRVREWAERLADWLVRGVREVYIAVHWDDPIGAWGVARRFSEALAEAVPGASVRGVGDLPAPAARAATEHPSTAGEFRDPETGQLTLF